MSKHNIAPQILVNTPEPTDGAALYVYEFVRSLAKTAAPVTLLCPGNFDYCEQLQAAGIPFVSVPSRPVSQAGLAERIWRNIKWVVQSAAIQWRATRRGDLVHFQFLIHLPLAFVFLLLIRMKGARLVLTAHDPLPHKWRLPPTLRWLEHRMLHLAYHLFDVTIVHNQSGRAILIDEFAIDDRKIAIIPHGPLAAVSAAAAYPPLDKLRLLLFGSIRENKGVHLAIKAVQKLAAAGCPVHLSIAGAHCTSGQSEYWERCKQMIAHHPTCIDVIERYIADPEIAPLFARHHAALLPYLDFFSESGVASLALSHQRPLIATGAGGLQELLTESGGGILIHQPTADAVASAIQEALASGSAELLKRGIAGAEYIRGVRSWKVIAQTTIDVYARLTESSAASLQGASASIKSRSGAPGTT